MSSEVTSWQAHGSPLRSSPLQLAQNVGGAAERTISYTTRAMRMGEGLSQSLSPCWRANSTHKRLRS